MLSRPSTIFALRCVTYLCVSVIIQYFDFIIYLRVNIMQQIPIKAKPWANILKAFDYGALCAQNDFTNGSIIGDEDCLFLNVFSPGKTHQLIDW
jgi:hypothetical protein